MTRIKTCLKTPTLAACQQWDRLLLALKKVRKLKMGQNKKPRPGALTFIHHEIF
jgi:hypothetical protein